MTIAISIKINDGVILATDSASTIIGQDGKVVKVYNNTNKLFNLYKGLPIGCITWGLGNIGSVSIETLTKDFRKQLVETLDKEKYSIKEIADRHASFILDLYNKQFQATPQEERPIIGFIIAGYSKDAKFAEEYKIEITNGNLGGPYLIRQPEITGMSWNGEYEPITRLYLGFSSNTFQLAKKYFHLDDTQTDAFMNYLRSNQEIPLVIPSMPVQDAIELAEFFVDFVENFSKYRPGPNSVGGPIEIAAITKHEGFKWVKRKHYFDNTYNPL